LGLNKSNYKYYRLQEWFKIFSFVLIFLIGGNASAQNIYNVKSLSMGGTSVANTYGLDGFNNNPANIMKVKPSTNPKIEFSLLSGTGFSVNGSWLSTEFFNKYGTNNDNKIYTNEDKWDIVNSAADNESSFLGSINLASFIIRTKKAGTFGISVDDKFIGNEVTNRDLLELMFFGNQKNRTYDISNSNFYASWIRQINLTYANFIKVKDHKKYGDFFYGISIKPQLGYYYIGTRENNFSLYTNDTNKVYTRGHAVIDYAATSYRFQDKMHASWNPTGKGLGFDLGGSIKVKDFLGMGTFDFALSIIDIGFVTWNQGSRTFNYDGGLIVTDITDSTQLAALDALIDANTIHKSFTTMLPTVIKFGFNYRVCLHKNGEKREDSMNRLDLFNFSFEYQQGLTNTSGGTTKPAVSFGFELNPLKQFSLRLGARYSGRDKFNFTAGIGIDTGPVVLDAGTFSIPGAISPNSNTRVAAGASIKFKIQ